MCVPWQSNCACARPASRLHCCAPALFLKWRGLPRWNASAPARLFVSVYRNGSSRCWAVVVRVEIGPLKTLRSAPSTSHEQCSRGKALGSGRRTVAVEPACSRGRKDNSLSLDGLIQHRVALPTQDPAKGAPCPRVSGSKVKAGVRARTTTLHTRDVCVALREPEVPRAVQTSLQGVSERFLCHAAWN